MLDVRDEGDIAKDYQDRLNQDSLNRVLAEARRPAGPGSEVCKDCGETIPKDRRDAKPGCILCVPCKSARERLQGGM